MKITGIYKIISKIHPNRIYIGSAVNIRKRWTNHLHKLRNNIHHSPKLQNHFNKYGEDDLNIEILEECVIDEKFVREQYYIDLYNPWFNVCKIAGSTCGRIVSEETKIKLKNKSRQSVQKWRNSRINGSYAVPKSYNLLEPKLSKEHIDKMRNSSIGIPILQYSLDGEFIKEWHGAKTAAKDLNVYSTGICRCLKGKNNTAYGYIWKYK